MSLKASIKKYYLSPWFIILFAPVLILSFALRLSTKGVSQFVYHIPIINIFLTVFITVFSVYAFHSIREIEWSLKSRGLITIKTLAAADIFCFSAAAVPVIFIVFCCIQNGIALRLAVNFILFIAALTAAEVIFLSALGAFIGSAVRGKPAYAAAVLFSLPFTPAFQNFLMESKDSGNGDFSFIVNLSNLINLSYDDPSRVKYAGYGMPFNGETVLSWIITALLGLVFIFLTLIIKRCFKLKGTAVLGVFAAAAPFSGAYGAGLYFELAPVINVFNYTYTDKPPVKIDTANIYSDPHSPVISRYNMKLDTGNTVKNICELELKVNNNSNVKLRLDQCFEIRSLTVDGESSRYDREGDYFTAELDPSKETSVITVEYGGRINYADALNNKTDVCDYTGGFLSEMFAWYPKLLSSQNTKQPKEFTVEINAVNSFVTNLDGYSLHPSGLHTVKGEKTDILFYLGYIDRVENGSGAIIMPLEHRRSAEKIEAETLALAKSGELEIKTYKNRFIESDIPSFNDYLKTETTLISYDELKALLNGWADSVGANGEQKQTISGLVLPLKDMWDDSLIEKAQNPEFVDSEEFRALIDLSAALGEIWESCTKEDISAVELSEVNTVVVIPYSYNITFDMYLFDDCLIASEGSITSY